MQNTNTTSAHSNYLDEELWNTWNSSSVRARHIDFLIADGCSPKAASTQADFDFDSYTRKLRDRGSSAEYNQVRLMYVTWQFDIYSFYYLYLNQFLSHIALVKLKLKLFSTWLSPPYSWGKLPTYTVQNHTMLRGIPPRFVAKLQEELVSFPSCFWSCAFD
jgi:hypothetical protein